MRRPIIWILLSFLFGIALQHYMKLELLILVPVAFDIVLFLFLRSFYCGRKKWERQVSVFLLIVVLAAMYVQIIDFRADPLENYEGCLCTIRGRVITVQVKSEYSYQLLVKGEDHRKRLVHVKGTMEEPADYIGKMIQVRGRVEMPAGRRNPNLFDYKLYLKTKGIRVILSSCQNQIELLEDGTNLLTHVIAHLKYSFMARLEKQMEPEAYGLMVGMLFGDRSFMSDEIYNSFQKNGIAHILSVSGIHVGIVYLYISRFFGGRKNLPFYLISSVLLLFYAALAEFSPSVIRSVVMIFIYMISKLTYQRYDFTCCTAASALAMLLVNPYYLFNTGFQLSYLAVFCLTVILPWAERRIDRLSEYCKNELLIKIIRYLTPLFVIQLGMAPLTAYCFNYFSVASFFLNIPIIAISGLIIPIGITLIPLSFVGGILFGVGAQAAELMIFSMTWLNDFFYLPGIGFFNLVSPSAGFLALYYALLFFLSTEFLRILYQRKRVILIAKICTVILLVSLLIQTALVSDCRDAELIFLDVGQGDCLYLNTPGGKNVLIDGGGSVYYDIGTNTLLPFLLKNKVSTVDLALVTHLHDDHYLGLTQLAQNMNIRSFGTYEANRLREKEILAKTGLRKGELVYLSQGDRINLDKDVWIDILYPPAANQEEYENLIRDGGDENQSSLFMKVTYEGLTVLMTGDLDTEGEEKILDYYQTSPNVLRSDILKVGHHGSRYSTSDDFLDAVNPAVAVFQVGKNNFGHPHRTIIDKCNKKGIMVYRNDLDGAVIFDKEGQTWHIRTMLQKNTHSKELEKS